MRKSPLFAVTLLFAAIACTSSTDGSSSGGTSDAGTTPDSSTPTDSSVPVDSGMVPDTGIVGTCNGCVKGPVGNGMDSITLTSVTGIVDGQADSPVVVSGTYHLDTAAEAVITSTCEGQSSGERKTVAGGDGNYTLNVDFQICATDIVKVTLFPKGESSSNNYVKCCFKKGKDF